MTQGNTAGAGGARRPHNPFARSKVQQKLAVARLALAEFLIGFSFRSTGATGARDFLALAAFFGLMMFLVMFGWSVRNGLWARIEQVLLGALPSGETPIRLSYHIDNSNKINTNILSAFREKFGQLSIVPQRTGDGATGAIILPGIAPNDDRAQGAQVPSWGPRASDKRTTQFRIEAAPLDSPVWRWIASKAPPGLMEAQANTASPLLVALNRHLFREHFRYASYRAILENNELMPCVLQQRYLPDIRSIDELTHIILETKENIRTEAGRRSTVSSFQAFQVIWVDSFPTPEQTAMFVPLSTFEVLEASAQRQQLELNLEDLAGVSGRVSTIRLAEVDLENDGIAEMRKLGRCLGAGTAAVSAPASGEGKDKRRLCRAADASEDAAALQKPAAWSSDQAGSCEQLRARTQIRFPRLLENGQDMMVCTGEHRRLRGEEVSACAQASGLGDLTKPNPTLGSRLVVTRLPPRRVAWLGPSRLAVPCGALADTDLVYARALAADREVARLPAPAAGVGTEPATEWVTACEAHRAAQPEAELAGGDPAVLNLLGYDEITVYAAPTSGDTLDSVTKSLLLWERNVGRNLGSSVPVLRLDPSYESALIRFGVLSLIIQNVSTPLALGGLVLYVFLTSLILSTAIDHRRRQYGLILMTGVGTKDLGSLVRLQVVMACFVGGIVGYGAFLVIANAVNDLLSKSAAIADARRIVGLDVTSFIPAIGLDMAYLLWIGMTFLAYIVAGLILRLHSITTAKAPIELVKS